MPLIPGIRRSLTSASGGFSWILSRAFRGSMKVVISQSGLAFWTTRASDQTRSLSSSTMYSRVIARPPPDSRPAD